MVEVIDTTNKEDISAYLTASFISNSPRVESARAIIDIWDSLQKNINVKNNLDFVSLLLATGRVMDVKEELDFEKYVDILKETSEVILSDLKKRGHNKDLHHSHLLTAMISSACISSSSKIETINEIIDYWEQINREMVIKTDIDKLACVLTMGRVMESQYEIDDLHQVIEVFDQLKEELSVFFEDHEVEQIHIASAFFANAYTEISPRVERIQDIIVLWLEAQEDLEVKDKIDYITSILTYGRIRDLKEEKYLADCAIPMVMKNLRKFIETNQ
ncbi:MAG: hypothetical protein ACFFG0_36115 [Candidatus Thorarchaeota archaeon]